MARQINLALQGGGAHGAFAWGVIDRLLDEDDLQITGISGTSAGALNGAALKAGLALGQGPEGRQAARANLAYIWHQVGQVSDSLLVRWLYSMVPAPRFLQRWTEAFSPFALFEQMNRHISPYDFGPFYTNPLAAIIKEMPHPLHLHGDGPALYVTATNVRTGRIRIFENHEITPEAIMASACLPTVFKAVEIKDAKTGKMEYFWDGGYSGNPALFPLYNQNLPADIVIVNINPMLNERIPHSPTEIEDRVNEVSFNASLLAELRSVQFVKKLFKEGRLEGRGMKVPLLHMIKDDALMSSLNSASKILPKPGLVEQLYQSGKNAAEAFLQHDAHAIGQRDSFDTSMLLS